MMPSSRFQSISSIRCLRMLAAAWLFAMWVPCAYSQDQEGCEGVGFTKQLFTKYSPENLQKRLEQDPKDVDALINLGIHLEEQDQIVQADGLYERAIQAKPDCYLGYLFGGLVKDRIGRKAFSDAEAGIRKALSLNPSLRNDGNVQGFMKRHPQLVGVQLAGEKESSSSTSELLPSANRFLVGMAAGLLLAAPFLYFARRKQSASA